jgi:NADH-quinone oxidoreductase subunit N
VLIDDFRGYAYRRPLLALSMVVFMLSLAGLPPMGGFIAKITI